MELDAVRVGRQFVLVSYPSHRTRMRLHAGGALVV